MRLSPQQQAQDLRCLEDGSAVAQWGLPLQCKEKVNNVQCCHPSRISKLSDGYGS